MEALIVTPVELTDADRARHERTIAVAEFGEAAQGRLKAARVCCIGAGGLGGPCLTYLVASGVGHVTVVDDDVVETRNLQRQVLYGSSTVGVPKAEAAATRLRDLNPDVDLRVELRRLTDRVVDEVIAGHDVVIDAVDNLATRLIIADACRRLDLPLVYGAVQAASGQVTVFWERLGLALADLFPNSPESCPTASEVGVLGPMTGWVGSVMATEVVKLLTGVGEPLLGRVMFIDTLGGRVAELPLRPRKVREGQ